MHALSEDAFRSLLDAHGVLRSSSLTAPERAATYAVFSQQRDARLDLGGLKRHAERFFSAKIGLTVDKSYVGDPVMTDAARFVLANDDGTASGTRLCFARAASDDDRLAALHAEEQQGTTGLALLARRCPMIWLIVPETEEDRVALTLAAIFASTMLGPILPPSGTEIFGVRTARLKLESRTSPYR